MTNKRENIRNIDRFVRNTTGYYQGLNIREGRILDIDKDSGNVRVEIMPDGDDEGEIAHWIGGDFDNPDSRIGGMPSIGTHCLVLILNNDIEDGDIYGNIYCFGGITKGNEKKAESSEANDDDLSYSINPPNGGSIEFFKDSDGKETIKIIAKGDKNIIIEQDKNEEVKGNINLIVQGNVQQTITGNVTQDVTGKVDINSGDIKLGNNNLDHLATKTGLNASFSKIADIHQQLGASTYINAFGIPIPIIAGFVPYGANIPTNITDVNAEKLKPANFTEETQAG